MSERRWPITAAQRQGIVTRLSEIVNDPSSETKEQIAAGKALLSCESQNQSDEHKVIFNNDPNRFAKNAEDLGLDVAFVESVTPTGIATEVVRT